MIIWEEVIIITNKNIVLSQIFENSKKKAKNTPKMTLSWMIKQKPIISSARVEKYKNKRKSINQKVIIDLTK